MAGAYRTYRIAVENDSMKFSNGKSNSAFAPFHCNRAKITTTKQRAFVAKNPVRSEKVKQNTTQRWADDSRNIQLQSTQRRGGRQLFVGNHVRNNCGPGGGVKRKADTD